QEAFTPAATGGGANLGEQRGRDPAAAESWMNHPARLCVDLGGDGGVANQISIGLVEEVDRLTGSVDLVELELEVERLGRLAEVWEVLDPAAIIRTQAAPSRN